MDKKDIFEKCPVDAQRALQDWVEFNGRSYSRSWRQGYSSPQTSGRLDVEDLRSMWRAGTVRDAIDSFCRTELQRLFIDELAAHMAAGRPPVAFRLLPPSGRAVAAVDDQAAALRRRIEAALRASDGYPQSLAADTDDEARR